MPIILKAQAAEGYWSQPLGGYSPKYQGTIWQILIPVGLGADASDKRVRHECEHVLDHSIASNGASSAGMKSIPNMAMYCLNGNMLHALVQVGYLVDPPAQGAIDGMARAIMGEREYAHLKSGTTGPGFGCSVNLA